MISGSRITTEDLTVGHRDQAVLEHVQLELPQGALTALIGVNGIGKSTLLHTLAGLLDPMQGRVLIEGEDLAAMSMAQRARHIAVVLTGRPDTGLLAVEELVALGRHPWTGRWGALAPADRLAVDHALRHSGILHLRTKQAATCSDGEFQKVLIARALAQETPVLLLDEPTAFLDLPNRAEVVRVLRSIAHGEGRTVLFSTHDLQLALDLCDRLVLLRGGDALWQGTPQEAMASGELDRAFSGSGVRFNPIDGTHRFVP